MRLTTFITGAALLVCFCFLGFRILDLEQRVALLSEQVGVPEVSSAPRSASGPSSHGTGPAKGYEQRLVTLEKRVDGLASREGTSHANDSSGLPKEEAILSVIDRENSRIRDVQLEWHRGRWLEGREYQLSVFAQQQQLVPAQRDALRIVLEHEADAMVAVLKKPGLAEDPDQAAADWQAVLRETDTRARSVLTPEQQQAWDMARFFERRVLWPWLPEQATAQR